MKLLASICFIGIIYLSEGRSSPNVQQYGRNELRDAPNYNEEAEYQERYPETYNEDPQPDRLPAAAYPSDMQRPEMRREEENARIYETPNEPQQEETEENIRERIENERFPAAEFPSNIQAEDLRRNAAFPSNIQPAGLRNVELANNEPNTAREVEAEREDEEAEDRAMSAEEDEEEMDEEEMVEELAGRMMSWWRIYPGTKWCGAGKRSDEYNDLGKYKDTDICCREHDHCPNSIPRKTTRFGLKNRLWFTMSECSCDKKFLGCLNRVNKYPSKTIKMMYFSFQPCFTLSDGKATRSRIRP